MAIDDGVHLVGTGYRLIDALRIDCDDALGLRPFPVEAKELRGRKLRRSRRTLKTASARFRQCLRKAACMRAHIGLIGKPAIMEIIQQAEKERHVAVGCEG